MLSKIIFKELINFFGVHIKNYSITKENNFWYELQKINNYYLKRNYQQIWKKRSAD